MDPIWRTLPLELSERICNMLPKVRSLPAVVRGDIRTGQLEHMLSLLDRFHDRYYSVNAVVASIHDFTGTEPVRDWSQYWPALNSAWIGLDPSTRDDIVDDLFGYMKKCDVQVLLMFDYKLDGPDD
jgi:hypothetical protein